VSGPNANGGVASRSIGKSLASCRPPFGGLLAVLLCGLAQPAQAQLPIPRIASLFPPGAKQGSAVEVQVQGTDLNDTTRLYFSHPGLTAEKLPDEQGKPLRFKIAAAADVPVGHYDVRSVGKYGISNPRTFVVGDLPEALEQEPNNQRPQAQRVELGSTINGQVNPGEDVDWFVFGAKAGQRVLIEAWGKRIDSRVDGFLWLFDANGRELAASQDETSRDEKNDPLIDCEIPADGDYFVKFTDFMYNGSTDCFYRLTFGRAPLIDFVLPTGAKPGETAAITVFGRNLPGGEKTDWRIGGRPLEKLTRSFVMPAPSATSLQLSNVVRAPASRLNGAELRIADAGAVSNDKLIVASQFPEIIEQEPNNAPAQAQRLTVPCAVSGQFNPTKDADCFVFSAKKGTPYTMEVFAQRIGSPGDPDLEVLNPKGEVMANPQDDGENIGNIRFSSFTRDLRFDFTPPEDGDYTLRLEHLYGQVQGGPAFVYRLELNQRSEDFQLICQPPSENRVDSHVVRQGGRERLDILVWRLNGHNLPITLTARNLPAGVTSEPFVLAPGLKWGTLVLSAAADAPLAEAEFEVVGTTEVNGAKVERKARGGVATWDTGNTSAASRMTRSLMLAVRDAAPLKLTATPAQSTLKAGEPLALKFDIARRPEYPLEVRLTAAGYQLPSGLDVMITPVPADQNQANLSLNLEKMNPGTYSFIVNAEVQVPFEIAPNNKQNLRCLYPSNVVTFTIQPREPQK
jgi:hypothetical protein